MSITKQFLHIHQWPSFLLYTTRLTACPAVWPSHCCPWGLGNHHGHSLAAPGHILVRKSFLIWPVAEDVLLRIALPPKLPFKRRAPEEQRRIFSFSKWSSALMFISNRPDDTQGGNLSNLELLLLGILSPQPLCSASLITRTVPGTSMRFCIGSEEG
jgi:hypothetical protein